MLRSCFRPLVTLVLALVAAGVLSTLCPARELQSHVGSLALSATGRVEPRPSPQSGEPDQPLSPPPLAHQGIRSAPLESDSGTGLDFVSLLRWIRVIWASWYAGEAF